MMAALFGAANLYGVSKVTVHTVVFREACYCSQHAAFWRGVNQCH